MNNRGSHTRHIGATLAFFLGLTISVALISYHSFYAIGNDVWRIGWGLGPILAIHFIAIVCCGAAWRALFPPEWPSDTRVLVALRWLRESVNTLLPVARIGGDIVAIRLLTVRGQGVHVASAGIVADRTVEVLSQFLFALAGVLLLIMKGGHGDLARSAILGLAIISSISAILLAAQRWGLLRVVETAVSKLAGKSGATAADGNINIHAAVWSIYSSRARIALATLLHTLGWVLGVAQIMFALHLMGHELRWADAFILESLSQVVCTAAFVMPAALGAQEAAYMTIGGIFGIPAEAGLALSIVKRLSDVLIGIPGLLVWQGFEGHSIWSLLKRRRSEV